MKQSQQDKGRAWSHSHLSSLQERLAWQHYLGQNKKALPNKFVADKASSWGLVCPRTKDNDGVMPPPLIEEWHWGPPQTQELLGDDLAPSSEGEQTSPLMRQDSLLRQGQRQGLHNKHHLPLAIAGSSMISDAHYPSRGQCPMPRHQQDLRRGPRSSPHSKNPLSSPAMEAEVPTTVVCPWGVPSRNKGSSPCQEALNSHAMRPASNYMGWSLLKNQPLDWQ